MVSRRRGRSSALTDLYPSPATAGERGNPLAVVVHSGRQFGAAGPGRKTMNVARKRPYGTALAAGIAGVWLVAFSIADAPAARAAATTGKVQGKVVATDNGEPIGFADVLLIPADTTLKKVGMLTNADGTFLIEAAPGRYTIQV